MNANVGLVTFITNSPYGSIHKFCPSQDFMDRLQKNQLDTYAYYSENGIRTAEKQEYNSNPYELHVYDDYFAKNYNLRIAGYINQEQNLYLISKLVNYGLTFIVLNLTYAMQIPTILSGVGRYLKIIKRNSPNSAVALLMRYPDSNKWCILNTSKSKVIESVKNQYTELIDVIVHPFSYTADYDITYETFIDIRKIIEKYYSDKSRFISFTKTEYDVSNNLLNGSVFGKKTAYSEKTIKAICDSSGIDGKSLTEKLVKSGVFNHFDGDIIGKYYFKNGEEDNRIIPVLLNIFNNTTYLKKRMDYGCPARHFVTPYLFRRSIPMKFKDKIAMSDRLILKILDSINVGRATLSGKRVYLRRYDIGEFSRSKSEGEEMTTEMRFIYD